MKKKRYCPYCGAVLSDNVVSFCLNYKKEVVGGGTVERQKTRKNKQRKRQDKTQPIVGVGYGEYYEDIVPKDAACVVVMLLL